MLPIRSIAVSAAVLGFFIIGIVGSCSGLSPYTCCQRAILGATVAYLTAGAASKAINAILTQAIITSQVKKREQTGDSRN